MKAGIFSGEAADRPVSELVAEVQAQPSMAGARLAEEVTTDQPYTVEPADHGWEGEPLFEVAVIDLGIKAATPRHLAQRGVRLHVLPATARFEDVTALDPDGVFLSNGPGDPATADAQVGLLTQVLDAGLPFSGSASATRSSGGPWASAPTSCPSATADRTNPSWTRRPGGWRSPRRTMDSPWTHRWARW